MKRIAYFSIVVFLSVMVSSCTEINETERAPTVERKIVETQASGKIVSRITPNPGKSTIPTPRATSRVLPDYSGLNDPQVEEQFLSFEAQLDYLSSNPESLNEWIELISLGNSSFILPELPNCRGSKVRRCFDELMPAVERAKLDADYMPGSHVKDIPGSDACIIMNYTYGIVKIYGEPQSDEHPETNSNFETMVKYNFIGTSTTSNESELSNFRWAFHHRNHWDYLVHCVKPKNVEEQFLSFEVQLDSLSSNPESLNEWIELISLGNSSFILPELPNCRGSKVRRCFDELMPAVERAIEMPGSRINDIPGSDACIIMNYTYGIVKIYGEPQSDEHPETNSNFETMVKYNFINESELSNFRWAFHHRNHWDYSNHCL